MRQLRDDFRQDYKQIGFTIGKNKIEWQDAIKYHNEQIEAFDLKCEAILKSFKRLTCDWLKMEARLEK